MLYCGHEPDNIQAVVMLGGDAPGPAAAARVHELAGSSPPPLLAAADRGADHLAELGLMPDIIIGDNDSRQGQYPNIPRLDYPAAKDITDGAAALEYALGNCEGRVVLAGAMGGRADHQLANMLLPLAPGIDSRRVLLLGDDFLAGYSSGYCRISGRAGQTVSLIPLSGEIRGLSLKGFEYPLHEYTARLGESRTVSNVLSRDQAEIRHDSGVLMVFELSVASGEW